jgi:hypothetical protein
VLTLVIPIRKMYGMEAYVTDRHLDYMAKTMLGTGMIVVYSYAVETFIGWYSGDANERFIMINRAMGPYAWSYWALIFCNCIAIQLLWFKAVRLNHVLLFVLALVVNIGMWLERFVIVIISLHRDFMPSSWHEYYPTFWDYATFLGTIGFFLACMFLFLRVLPMISISEVGALLHATEKKAEEAVK